VSGSRFDWPVWALLAHFCRRAEKKEGAEREKQRKEKDSEVENE